MYFSCRGAGEGETWGENRVGGSACQPHPPASPPGRLFRVFCCTKPGRSRFESYYRLGQPAQVRILSLSASNDNVSEWSKEVTLVTEKYCDSKRCNSHVACAPDRLELFAIFLHGRGYRAVGGAHRVSYMTSSSASLLSLSSESQSSSLSVESSSSNSSPVLAPYPRR
jgi:hypothetical protein